MAVSYPKVSDVSRLEDRTSHSCIVSLYPFLFNILIQIKKKIVIGVHIFIVWMSAPLGAFFLGLSLALRLHDQFQAFH